MSKYTISIYDLDRDINGDDYSSSVDERLDKIRELIFDFNYPIIDDTTKKRIEIAILKHYYMREFAFETVGLFKLKLNDRLNMIMSRYNKMYAYYDKEINPFINSYLKEKGTNDSTGNTESNTNSTNNSDTTNFHTESQTPQGILNELKEGKYSSFAYAETNNVSSDDDSQSNTSTTNNSEYEREIESLQGMSQAEAFRSYFDNLISIDEELVNELSDLFLIIW